jgi:hypothetical protein
MGNFLLTIIAPTLARRNAPWRLLAVCRKFRQRARHTGRRALRTAGSRAGACPLDLRNSAGGGARRLDPGDDTALGTLSSRVYMNVLPVSSG